MNEELKDMIGRIDTIDIYWSPLVALWMREKAKRDPIAFCRLIQDNKDRAARFLGKGVRVQWGQEYFTAWEIDELGVPLFFLSGPKGSVFLINYPGGGRSFATDRKMGSAITGMLERLLITLSGFGVGR